MKMCQFTVCDFSNVCEHCDGIVHFECTNSCGLPSFEQDGCSQCKHRRKESERKEAERKEAERKETERKEAERKETERKETERKETELGFLQSELREVNIKLAKSVAQAENAQQENVKALSVNL